MKLLFLSFYFEPDLSAGSYRASSLLKHLSNKNLNITIISTMPNRYSSFLRKAESLENKNNTRIYRLELPPHKSGMVDQAKAFIAFYKKAMKIIKKEKYDAVYATSSRLFTAYLGAVVSKKMNIPLYLDIRDIFLDTIKDIISPTLLFFIKPFLKYVENFTFNNAEHINLVSRGFEDYFLDRFSCNSYSFYTNGIDNEFLNKLPPSENSSSKKIILYAGNIGYGQGLDKIIPNLAKKLPDYNFVCIGDGGRKEKLSTKSKDIKNIKLLNPMNREDLLKHYMSSDVLFIHLNDNPAFKKVLPSKIFEYAATEKPILAGVDGYAANFIGREIRNSRIFKPCDDEGAINALKLLTTSEKESRKDFIEKYSREKIMSKMADSIFKKLMR